ncbi:MAG: hypothetical protein R3E13_07170 [Alphaproteobacteria bacterium]
MLEVKAQSFRVGCFVVALLLYGALGSPTPDNPGVLEVVIAGLLVLAVGVSGALRVFTFEDGGAGWKQFAQVFLMSPSGMVKIPRLQAKRSLYLSLCDVIR